MPRPAHRALFWSIISVVIVVDYITKWIAVETLTRFPRPVIGDLLTFHLVYNRGAAFGIHVGGYSRVVFITLALVALVILGSMVRSTPADQRLKLSSLALICAGAVGNLIDRLRSARGVVDFIDVGIGSLRWPTFNVADIAVTCGAVILAIVLWQEGREQSAAGQGASSSTTA